MIFVTGYRVSCTLKTSYLKTRMHSVLQYILLCMLETLFTLLWLKT